MLGTRYIIFHNGKVKVMKQPFSAKLDAYMVGYCFTLPPMMKKVGMRFPAFSFSSVIFID